MTVPPLVKKAFTNLQAMACALCLAGIAVLLAGMVLPIYTSSDAPAKLSQELRHLPSKQGFRKWYAELPKYETEHKRLADIGRGLIALAIGISASAFFLRLLRKKNARKAGWLAAGFWVLLWAVKFPLTIWYYGLREWRFDYPIWGDSIVIAIYRDWAEWMLGLIILSVLLWLLLIRRTIPQRIQLRMPRNPWDWIRAAILWFWFLWLPLCIFTAVMDGDEGMAISCTSAVPIILLALSATEKPKNKMRDKAVSVHG